MSHRLHSKLRLAYGVYFITQYDSLLLADIKCQRVINYHTEIKLNPLFYYLTI